jgi:hypothetical protein
VHATINMLVDYSYFSFSFLEIRETFLHYMEKKEKNRNTEQPTTGMLQ